MAFNSKWLLRVKENEWMGRKTHQNQVRENGGPTLVPLLLFQRVPLFHSSSLNPFFFFTFTISSDGFSFWKLHLSLPPGLKWERKGKEWRMELAAPPLLSLKLFVFLKDETCIYFIIPSVLLSPLFFDTKSWGGTGKVEKQSLLLVNLVPSWSRVEMKLLLPLLLYQDWQLTWEARPGLALPHPTLTRPLTSYPNFWVIFGFKVRQSKWATSSFTAGNKWHKLLLVDLGWPKKSLERRHDALTCVFCSKCPFPWNKLEGWICGQRSVG